MDHTTGSNGAVNVRPRNVGVSVAARSQSLSSSCSSRSSVELRRDVAECGRGRDVTSGEVLVESELRKRASWFCATALT